MHGEHKKIGLFDHMGYGNMGDAAVQESFIANIRKRLPNAALVAFSLYPDDTRERHEVPSYPIRWCYIGWRNSDSHIPAEHGLETGSRLKSFLKSCRILYALAKPLHDCLRELTHLIRSYRIVRSLDLLIMSGGGQLCELYGDLPYNVFKFCVLARLSNTPVFIVGVGADLLKRPLNKFFARWAVRLANYVSFRSVESRRLVRSLGVKRETHVCPDPAYALDLRGYLTPDSSGALTPAQSKALLRKFCPAIETQVCEDPTYVLNRRRHKSANPSNRLTPTVGLNPIGFCDPRRWPRKDGVVYDRYLDNLVAFSAWLLAQDYQLEVFTSEITADVYAIEDLKKRLVVGASSHATSRVSFRSVLTLNELLLQMSTFDFVVTSKFHGVIFSHLLGKPVIALSYLPKIDHLMQTVGHGQYCLGIEHFDVNWIIERFKSLVQEKDRLTSLFRQTSAAYADMLKVEFDRVLLPGARSLAHEGDNGSVVAVSPEVSRVPARR
jgi:polysaccharide pyruvyl transferase WcaK-like protein